MAELLSEEWLSEVAALAADLPKVAGVDVSISFEVAGAPAGKVRVHADVASGQLATFAPGANKSAECNVIVKAPIALALIAGELDPHVAYMRGDLKIEGDYPKVILGLAPMTSTDAFATFCTAVAACTE